jgi:hypothetical protein
MAWRQWMVTVAAVVMTAGLVPNNYAVSEEGFYSGKLVSNEVNGYFRKMSCAYSRGFHNATHSVGELYNTQREYETQKKGRPFIRQCAAFVDGTFRMIERAGSGVWDFFTGVIPGEQHGVAPTPETLTWSK